jgi:hypothetical protein
MLDVLQVIDITVTLKMLTGKHRILVTDCWRIIRCFGRIVVLSVLTHRSHAAGSA